MILIKSFKKQEFDDWKVRKKSLIGKAIVLKGSKKAQKY